MESYHDYLEHYGVKGQRWGVRRTPEQLGYRRKKDSTIYGSSSDQLGRDSGEKREFRRLKRRVSAAEYNLKNRARLASGSKENVDEAQKNYKKEMSRPSLSRKKKLERIEEATKEVKKALKQYEIPKAELKRAERVYNEQARNLSRHVNSMIKKYGKQNIQKLKIKDLSVGDSYCKSVINTGITFVNFPVFGKMWAGAYISGRDNEDRAKLLEEITKKKY